MAYTQNLSRLQVIYDYIKAHPGCRRPEICYALGMTKGVVANHITSMEQQGLLLYEDERDRLHAFAICPPRPAHKRERVA